ncbi:ATP-dependent DNA helicase [Candidatus Omnitrophota bacterium]
MKQTLHTSVRELVEFILRSGDLDLTVFGSINPQEAIRIHQKIQKSRTGDYQAEVTVIHTIETERFTLEIGGRIDGVFTDRDTVVIDEIKTTKKDPEALEQSDNRLHWGQAQCYAYIYAVEHELENIDVQLTYYHLDTGTTKEFRRSFDRDSLEKFFRSLVSPYLKWAGTLAEWRLIRDESIRVLDFPFPGYRAGQRRMAGDVYRAIREQNRLIVQAPTGIGKTMAVLFPSIKAVTEGLTSKLFYLTARTTGKSVAETALDILKGSGLRLKSLTLTAKEKVCFNPECACNGEECVYARDYYDRLSDAVDDAFNRDTFNRQDIEKLAEEHTLCPFEFSLDISLFADCIICDYNYAFDPRVYLRRFFLEGKTDYTFLIDEAHNLVDRARDMFSAELYKQPFLNLRRSVKQQLPGIYRQLGLINSWMAKARKQCEEEINPHAETDPPDDLFPFLRKFMTASEKWLSRNIATPFREELLDVYFSVTGFLRIAEQYNEQYASLYEKMDKDIKIKLFCIDPAERLDEALGRCRAAVFFSATMTPTDYFRTIFGCDESSNELVLPSPFPEENLCVIIADRISTLYKDRSKTKKDVAGALISIVRRRTGNYLLYFPSYEYMMMVHETFTAENPGTETIIQTRGMSEIERDMFLERYSHDNEKTLAGFVVMGGVFGEGIDLVGDRLTGAAIVGVGLPGLSLERDLIREYFMGRNGYGFEYAYLYPGINKVFQAAGRVIRSESDRGIVLLVDQRFITPRYAQLIPREWRPIKARNEKEIEEIAEDFWYSD